MLWVVFPFFYWWTYGELNSDLVIISRNVIPLYDKPDWAVDWANKKPRTMENLMVFYSSAAVGVIVASTYGSYLLKCF